SPTFVDLAGQPRIGDRGSSAADDVELSGRDDANHLVWIGEAADAHNRYFCDRLDLSVPGCLVIAGVEAGGTGIFGPFLIAGATDDDVPEIDEAAPCDQLHEPQPIVH